MAGRKTENVTLVLEGVMKTGATGARPAFATDGPDDRSRRAPGASGNVSQPGPPSDLPDTAPADFAVRPGMSYRRPISRKRAKGHERHNAA